MGNAESVDAQLTDFRARNKPPKLPMPDPAELEERFSIALVMSACSYHHLALSVKKQSVKYPVVLA